MSSRPFYCDACHRTSDQSAHVCERCHDEAEALKKLATLAVQAFPSLARVDPPVLFARLLAAAVETARPGHHTLPKIREFIGERWAPPPGATLVPQTEPGGRGTAG